MRRTLLPWVVIAAVLVLVFPAGRVLAQDAQPVTDDEVNAVARQLYCPVCENISLDVCPTQACAQWRGLIREKLEAGWSAEQIKQYFAAQYGDRVLPQPPRKGINWLVYILPPAMILAGAYLLVRVLRGLRAPRTVPAPPPALADKDPYLRRLEDELKQRKG